MLTNKPQQKRRWLDLAPGDTVMVVAGKDKGKQGEVLRTLPATVEHVIITADDLGQLDVALDEGGGSSRGRRVRQGP